MRTDRINFLDFEFDRLTFEDVATQLQCADASRYAYVVTPNVDHVVRADREPQLRRVYEAADMCVCDSRILSWLAWARGIDLPVVPGSDLVEALFSNAINPGDTIAVVGGSSEFVHRLRRRFVGVKLLHHAAPMGLRHNPEARRAAAAFVASSGARFTFVVVGSPQQELIANEAATYPNARGVALCVGAGLEFLLGDQKRAPKILRRIGLEWAHRLATNPRRLWRRYLVDGLRVFPIYLRWRGRMSPVMSAGAVLLLTLYASSLCQFPIARS